MPVGQLIGNGELVALKHEIATRGGRPEHVADRSILTVLERVGGDIDLAATAIIMEPRPEWLSEIIPHGAGLRIKAR